MELLGSENVASVILFDVRLSEGEIQTFATALAYMLETLDDAHLHAVFNSDGETDLETSSETRQFLEVTLQELMSLIQEHCHVKDIPPRFRELASAWRVLSKRAGKTNTTASPHVVPSAGENASRT